MAEEWLLAAKAEQGGIVLVVRGKDFEEFTTLVEFPLVEGSHPQLIISDHNLGLLLDFLAHAKLLFTVSATGTVSTIAIWLGDTVPPQQIMNSPQLYILSSPPVWTTAMRYTEA